MPLPAAPARPPKRRRTLLALLAVPVAGALATTVILTSTAGAEQTDTAGLVQAEAWSAQSGARIEDTGDTGGGKNVGWLANGDWIRYDNVDLGGPGSLTASVRVAAASRAGGTIELRAGTQDGELLASYPVGYTGGWQNWTTKTAVSATSLTGKQTVFLLLKSPQGSDFSNVNWLRFRRVAVRRRDDLHAGFFKCKCNAQGTLQPKATRPGPPVPPDR
ncbi:carbohydrate-binding protein [Dactylosporangium sp. CA-233914]|uniref:carbohydrate-binding protein n=1 Tax=Dactylosporangium sp. CA-233914 TaxID=3239934 RepID=UPI003D8D6042